MNVFGIAQDITQEEAARQKQYYNHKASSVTLHIGDVVLMHNDHHIGHQKLKDHWGDDTYQVLDQVNPEVLVYVIENKQSKRHSPP